MNGPRELVPRDPVRAASLRAQLYGDALGLLTPSLQSRRGDFFVGDGKWARAVINLDDGGQRGRFGGIVSRIGSLLDLAGVTLPPPGANGRVTLMLQNASMAVKPHRHVTNGQRGIIGRLHPPQCGEGVFGSGAFVVEHGSRQTVLGLDGLKLGEFNPHCLHWRCAGAVEPMTITFTVYIEAGTDGMPTEAARGWVQRYGELRVPTSEVNRRIFLDPDDGRICVVFSRQRFNGRESSDTRGIPLTPAKCPRLSLHGRPNIQVTFSLPSGASAEEAIDLT